MKTQNVKNTLLIMFTAVMLLVVLAMMLFYNVARNEKDIAEAEKNKYESYILADQMRQSSDDLTRMARSYINTGDERFIRYFNEILSIRDGKTKRPNNYNSIYWDFVVVNDRSPYGFREPISLKALMEEAGFSKKEFALLRESNFRSNTLARIEERALNAFKGLYEDDKGHYTVRGKTDPVLARNLLFSEDYHVAKQKVMVPVKKFFDAIESRTNQTLKAYRHGTQILNILLMLTLGLSFLLLLGAVLVVVSFFKNPSYKEGGVAEVQDASGWSGWYRKVLLANWHFVSLSALAIFLITGTSWWFYKKAEGSAHQFIGNRLSGLSEAAHTSVRDWIQANTLETRFLVEIMNRKISPATFEKMQQGPTRQVERELLDSGVFNSQLFHKYMVVNGDWLVVASHDKALVGQDFAPPLAVEEQMRSFPYQAFRFPQRGSHKLLDDHILIGSRLKGHYGAVFFFLSPRDSLTPLLGRFYTDEMGELYMVNKNGNFVSETRHREQVLERLYPDKNPSELEVLSVVGRRVSPRMSDDAAPLSRAALGITRKNDAEEPAVYKNYLNQDVFGLWRWDNSYDFGIVAETEKAESLAALSTYKAQALSGTGLTVILILLLTGLAIFKRAKLAESNRALKNSFQTIKQQNDKMARDLKIGQQVQMDMLPRPIKSAGFEIDALLQPAQSVAGDFYDFSYVPGTDKNKLYFSIGDVSGKGIPAALFMAVTKAFLRKTLEYTDDTKEIVNMVNKELARKNERCMFVTLIVGIMDLKTGHLQMTNAGHNPPYLKADTGGLRMLEETNGPLVGAFEDASFTAQSMNLGRKDTLLLYTDGVTEAQDNKNGFYEEHRLESLLRRVKPTASPGELAQSVAQDVSRFISGAPQSDDITVVAFNYLS